MGVGWRENQQNVLARENVVKKSYLEKLKEKHHDKPHFHINPPELQFYQMQVTV